MISHLKSILRNSVIRGSSLIFSGSAIIAISSFVLLPIWTRVLTKEEFGIIGTMNAYASILGIFVGLGLPGAMIRFIHDDRQNRPFVGRVVSTTFWSNTCLGIAICIISGVILWILSNYGIKGVDFWPYYPIVLFTVYLGIPIVIFNSYNNALERFGFVTLSNLVVYAIATATSLLLAIHFQMGALGKIAGPLVAATLAGFYIVIFPLRRYLSRGLDFPLSKKLLHFGIPLVPHGLATIILSVSDRAMLERMRGLEEAGIYTVVSTFSIATGFTVHAINQAWSPRYFRERLRGDAGDLIIRSYQSLWTFLMSAGFGVFGVLGAPVFKWLAGERYQTSSNLVVPIALGVLFFGTYQLAAKCFFYSKKSNLLPWITGGSALLNVILNLILIPHFGALGAAYTTFVSYAIMTIAAHHVSKSFNPQRDQIFQLMPWYILTSIFSLFPWDNFGIGTGMLALLFWFILLGISFRNAWLPFIKRSQN